MTSHGGRGLLALVPLLLLCVTQTSSLSGKNVCTKIETYEIAVTKTAQRPYVIREMVWCMQVPPRCPKIRTAYRVQTVFENVTKTRLVSECCEGYSELDDKCAPQCGGKFAGCGTRGRCVAPDVCKCDPGFHGNTCTQGYDLTTTIQPATMTSKYPTFDEDRYNEFDNDITSDLSHIVVPIMNTSRQQSTTTQVPKYTTIKNITTEEMIKSKTKQKSIKTESDKNKKNKLTTQIPNIENVTEISLLSATIENKTEITPLLPIPTIGNATHAVLPTIGNVTRAVLPTIGNVTHAVLPTIGNVTHAVLPTIGNVTHAVLPTIGNISDISLLPIIENITESYSATIEISTKATIENSTTSEHSTISRENSTTHTTTTMDKLGAHQSDDSSLLLTINNETLVHNQHLSFGIDLVSAIMLIIGASLSIILIALLLVLACHRNKVKPAQECKPQQCTSVIHSQLPPIPREMSPAGSAAAVFTPNNNVVILQHVTMATTNNTFKPAAQQPTISPALREALEATYDHPPTFRIDPNIGQRLSGPDNNAASSLSELWDAVVSSNNAELEDEHLYDEIPCWRQPRESSEHHMVTKC